MNDCCATGFLHSGTPTGSIEKLGSLDAYYSKSPIKSKAILFLSDIFGHISPNNQLLADAIARKTGFTVIAPDYLHGDYIDWKVLKGMVDPEKSIFGRISQLGSILFGAPKLATWFMRQDHIKTLATVESCLNDVLLKYESIAVVGYCFGGRYTAILGNSTRVKCVAMAHPSRLDIPAEISLKVPSLWICLENDAMFDGKARTSAKLHLNELKMESTFIEYPGTSHGFATRGSENDEKVVKAREKALQDVCEFFLEKM